MRWGQIQMQVYSQPFSPRLLQGRFCVTCLPLLPGGLGRGPDQEQPEAEPDLQGKVGLGRNQI